MRTLIRVASWAGVALIAALAFWVSYHAIKGVWITTGAGRREDAGLIPLLIDGFLVIVVLVIVSRNLDGVHGWRAYAYPWLLVGLATGVSVAANVAHAAPTLGARGLAGLVPLILFAAAELVARELLRTRKTRPVPEPVRPVLVEALDDRAGPQVQPSQDRPGRQPPQPGGDGLGQSPAALLVRGTAAPGTQVLPGEAARAGRAVRPGGWQAGDRGTAAVAGTSAPGTPRPGDPEIEVMTPREAVRHTLTARGVNASDVSPGDIINPVRVLTQADTSKRYVANILTELRKEPALIERNGKPQRDGEVRVR